MLKWSLKILLTIVFVAFVFYFLPENRLPEGTRIDRLVIHKSDKTMEAYVHGKLLKTYVVAIGQNATGDKVVEGDKRTPEGTYTIESRNPESAFHKNLGISYPNADDVKEAKRKGVSPGGEIKIHGLKNGLGLIGKFHRLFNWTAGCIAVTNEEMDELYASVEIGTPVEIHP